MGSGEDVEVGEKDGAPVAPVVGDTSQGTHAGESSCLSCTDARESDTGCCFCACENCFFCAGLHAWYECCHCKKYRSPAVALCEHCIGESATYGRRTFWSICFIPLVLIFVFLLFAEAAFWVLVAIVVLCLSLSVLPVLFVAIVLIRKIYAQMF